MSAGAGAPTLGGAGSAGVAGLLGGTRQPATVLGVFPAAVYLAVGDYVVAIVTRDGIHHPNAVVVGSTSAERPFAEVAVGTAGQVGAHAIEVPGLAVRVTRWWQPRPVLPSLTRDEVLAVGDDLDRQLAARAPLPVDLAGPLADVVAALVAADPVAAADVVRAGLLGRGPGLTPAGDDVVAGLCATSVIGAGPPRAADPLAADLARFGARVVDAATTRTTTVSAALLRHAAVGETCDVVASLLDALPDARRRAGALAVVLAVGATSGRDLAHGVVAGLRVLAARHADIIPAAPAAPAAPAVPA